MASLELLAGAKTVGTKQTLKAVEDNTVSVVFLAKDAENRIIEPLRRLCAEKSIPVSEVETMLELGKACQLMVGAAAAAVIK